MWRFVVGRRRRRGPGSGWGFVAAMLMAASVTVACASIPRYLDEPWPPDPATCLRHRHPDAAMNSGVRLATRGAYTRQSAHTVVVYFCFQRLASARYAAHLVTHISGCVTRVTPSVIDVPGEVRQWEAVAFTVSVCERGRGGLVVDLGYVGGAPGEVIDGAGVDVTADDQGVLIEEPRTR